MVHACTYVSRKAINFNGSANRYQGKTPQVFVLMVEIMTASTKLLPMPSSSTSKKFYKLATSSIRDFEKQWPIGAIYQTPSVVEYTSRRDVYNN